MKYDLAIIGAGIIGSFHAYHAAKKGLKVCLIEKDIKPLGSTIQNFGQVVPSGLDNHWLTFGRRSLEIYGDIQKETDLSMAKNGSVYIASDDDELTLLNELSQIHQELNYENLLLSQKGVLEKFPDLEKSYVKAGLYYPQELSVDPSLMVYKLIAYLQEKFGVVYYPNHTTIDIEEKNRDLEILCTGQKKIRAEKAVICSGYIFNLLYPEIYANSGLIVSKLQMMSSVPLPLFKLKSNILTGLSIRRYESFEACPSFGKIKTPQHLTPLKKYGIHILFKQSPDGRIIIGDSHEYAPATEADLLGNNINKHITSLIMTEARRILALPENCLEKQWAGRYAQHPAGIFEHTVSEKIQITTGIGGKGMTSSAGYAEAKIKSMF